MALDLTGIGAIADIAGGVMDRVWPKKMTGQEKADATAKFKEILLKEKKIELDDVASARAMAMKDGENAPQVVRLVRGLIRPVAGITAIGTWVASIWLKFYIAYSQWSAANFDITKAPDVTALLSSWDYAIIGGIMTFYFGTRTIEKNKGSMNRG